MLKLISILFACLFVIGLPLSVSAQQTAQNSGGLQSPSSNTQNTRNLQTPSSPTQGSNSNILEAQPDSLGVVGSPSQQQPSVTVGQSTSKTNISVEPKTESAIWSTVLIITTLALVFWVIYKVTNKINSKSIIAPQTEVAIEKIDPKIQSKTAKASTNKTTKNKKTGKVNQTKKKSKKKRNHR